MSLDTLAHVVTAIENERSDVAALFDDNTEAFLFYRSWTDEISAILVDWGHVATIRTVFSVHANGEDFEGFEDEDWDEDFDGEGDLMTEQNLNPAHTKVWEWCCDHCGNWNVEESTCQCGCTQRSWLPIEPSWRNDRPSAFPEANGV